LPVLPLTEPVLPMLPVLPTLLELPVLPLALPALLVEPVLPTLLELPVLPLALPALPTEPVLPTLTVGVLCVLLAVVPVLVPVLGADTASCPWSLGRSSPLPPLCRSPLESELPSPGSL